MSLSVFSFQKQFRIWKKILKYEISQIMQGVDKRRTDDGRRTADRGRRTADGGRRTADRGAFYKHMVINVLFHPFEFLEIKFFNQHSIRMYHRINVVFLGKRFEIL